VIIASAPAEGYIFHKKRKEELERNTPLSPPKVGGKKGQEEKESLDLEGEAVLFSASPTL
jgi:hypothetical protein